jgi:peptide/nickel transport system permease protein
MRELPMLAYSVRRLLLIIPVMLVVATTVFLLLYLTPGDPVGIILGADATEQQKAELRAQLGLDQPAYVQLMRWYRRLLQGDLGTSIFLNKAVTTAFLDRLEPTVMLTLLALTFSVLIGLPAGICAAKMRGSWFDMASMLIAITGVSMPTFWVGLNLIFIFAVSLGWLPVAGYQPLSRGLWGNLRYLLMPAFTLGFAQSALLARMTRSMMLEVLSQDYIRTAWAKGVAEAGVLFRHALRNAIIPLITIVGLSFALLLGGAVISEQIFNIPGVGRLLIQAVSRRDYPLVQGVLMIIAGIYMVVNLVVDLAYAYLDPRIRHSD